MRKSIGALLSIFALALLPTAFSGDKPGDIQSAYGEPSFHHTIQRRDFRQRLAAPTPLRSMQSWDPASTESDEGEVVLSWNPVQGASSYVIQVCESEACGEPQKGVSHGQNLRNQDEAFRTIATVMDARYVASGLAANRTYGFRVAGVDADGQPGSYSPVLSDVIREHRLP